MAKNKVRMDLDDRIWGISGTVDPNDYAEPAPGKSENQELIYVKYKPAIKGKKIFPSLAKRFLSKLPGFSSYVGDGEKKIPEAVPKNQVDEVYTPNVSGKNSRRNGAGQPERKLVLRQDADDNAPYEDRVKDRTENKLNQIEKEKSRAESDSITSQADAIDLSSEDEEDRNDRRGKPRVMKNKEVME